MSMCNGSIGADAIKLPALFTFCVKDIGSNGVLSYCKGMEVVTLGSPSVVVCSENY